MKNQLLLSALLSGVLAGQIFAIDETPVKISNTLRVGWSDNPYSLPQNEDDSFFVEDVLDLAFRASISDRTDITVKGRLRFDMDEEDDGIYPNFFGTLNHAFSSRLLFSLSDTFIMDDRNGTLSRPGQERVDFWRNTLNGDLTYLLGMRNRLSGFGKYGMERNDDGGEFYDYTRYEFGVSWGYDLVPQQTRTTLFAKHANVEFDGISGNHRELNQEFIYAQLDHTFSPTWQGNVRGGATYTQRKFGTEKNTMDPLFGAGIVYTPSPRTRANADIDYSYEQTEAVDRGGRMATQISLGIEHELTARVTVKSKFRFSNSDYSEKDSTVGKSGNFNEKFWDWDTRVSYKLNRMHSLEAGYRYSERESDNKNGNWTRNRVDIGWRVDL